MFRTGVKRPFTARHALRGDFGDETVPHSHPYTVEWICRTQGLDANGFSVDIALLERELEALLEELDDRLLNDLPFFESRQPSLENLALYLHQELRLRFRNAGGGGTDPAMEVRIWESPTAWASYSPSVEDGD
ncbi:6-pyruvoyl trahydropterin synthase family protein [Salinispira pacifica]